MELSGSSCYMKHDVGQEPKLQQNGKRTAGLLVVGYGRQLAVLGSSKICTVDSECMVGMAQVGLGRA
jgi:hypothetical protein